MENCKTVLIENPKKQSNEEKTYRHPCLIDDAGKILEFLRKNRLQAEMRNKGLELGNQYGFTKGKSTVNAIQRVTKTIEDIKKKNYQHRERSAL